MTTPVTLRVITEITLVVDDDLRPYQVVELLDAADKRTALFSRYLNTEETHWVRHGVFQAFYETGALKSEGSFRRGKEHGPWRDLYENGVVAAAGSYFNGEHVGTWTFRHPDGHAEEPDHYPPAPSSD